MLRCVGQSRDPLLVGARLVVEHRSSHRGERIAHDDDAQTVGKGRSRDLLRRGSADAGVMESAAVKTAASTKLRLDMPAAIRAAAA